MSKKGHTSSNVTSKYLAIIPESQFFLWDEDELKCIIINNVQSFFFSPFSSKRERGH